MPIEPDTKDWTWVLDRRCPECGFDAAAVRLDRVGALLLENAQAWEHVLSKPDSVLRQRPSHDRWSALEYGCHVRDVFRLYAERLQLMLDQDDPTYPNWDQDATAVRDQYNDQVPKQVSEDLVVAAGRLAVSFNGLADHQWRRTGSRSDGAHFTVDSFARYMVHDPVHHLHDVTVGLNGSPGA